MLALLAPLEVIRLQLDRGAAPEVDARLEAVRPCVDALVKEAALGHPTGAVRDLVHRGLRAVRGLGAAEAACFPRP